MMNVKHLVAGFALGLLIAVAPSCGGTKCTPSSCPTGCCDDKGLCQDGRTNNACGQLGNSCTVCTLGQACNLGTCMNGSNIGGGSGNGGGGGTTGGGGGTTGGGGGTTGGGGGTTGGGGGTTGGGGGTTGGGGGTTGGGGGGACDGCFFNGSCIIRANSNNDTLCGQGGVQCATCTNGAHCTNYVCTGGTGGGGGVTGGGGGTTGGGGGTTVTVGTPCTNSTQCAGLGAGATCKLQTTPFAGAAPSSYPSGFCTLPCTGTGTCPGTAACAGAISSYPYLFNEVDRFCTPSCAGSGQSTCAAGFQCLPVEPLTLTAPARGCFLSIATATYTGGGLPTKAGQPCTTDTQCGMPPDPILAQCLTAADGFPNGYCLIDTVLEQSGAWCQSAGRSKINYPLPDGGTLHFCAGTCTMVGTLNPGGRTGYTCYGNTNGVGNVVWTACASAADCGGSVPVCQTTTGFCCTDTTYSSCARNF